MVEAVTENEEVKTSIFKLLDKVSPGCSTQHTCCEHAAVLGFKVSAAGHQGYRILRYKHTAGGWWDEVWLSRVCTCA